MVTSSIISIEKGKAGNPGQIKGTIRDGKTIGDVINNTEFGIYGNLLNKSFLNINENNLYKVATRNEISQGNAQIILVLQDGIRKEYNIEITKIYANNYLNNKSMLIKVTDENLINLTGGIIQGMSGAPIVQNGKFVGAVTHVFVNNPLEGYAVFGDLMVKQSNIEKQ